MLPRGQQLMPPSRSSFLFSFLRNSPAAARTRRPQFVDVRVRHESTIISHSGRPDRVRFRERWPLFVFFVSFLESFLFRFHSYATWRLASIPRLICYTRVFHRATARALGIVKTAVSSLGLAVVVTEIRVPVCA